MLLKIRNLKRKEKGFTLVELIVVMVILAIIGAIAVPRYTATVQNAKEQANQANIMMIEKAAQLAVLNGDITPGDDTDDMMGVLTTKGYLDKAPENPENNFPYEVYVAQTAGAGGISDQFEITVDDGSGEGGGE